MCTALCQQQTSKYFLSSTVIQHQVQYQPANVTNVNKPFLCTCLLPLSGNCFSQNVILAVILIARTADVLVCVDRVSYSSRLR